jgi:FKBP-type peptidyl-prolyl cis-trans isomerase (trigger factor)
MTDKIIAKLNSNKDNLAIIEVVVNAQTAEAKRQDALQDLAQGVTIKGFRKGKAPIQLVEKDMDPQRILERAVNKLLPEILDAAFEIEKFKPLANPHIHLVDAKKDGEWKFEVEIPLQPEIDTKDVKEYISGELKVTTLWTPEKGSEEDKRTEEQIQGEKLQKIMEALLKKYVFPVPAILIEDEVTSSVSRLLSQLQSLNLSLEDYLKSINKTGDDLRDEYKKAAEENLRLEIILARVGFDLGIKIEDEDINAMIESTGDDKTKARLNTPEQRDYIREILRKRKTIDALMSL